MKKKVAFLGFLIVVLLLNEAMAAPYYSYMIDRDGWYRYSPSLYEPSHIINVDVYGVNDMMIAGDDILYIARNTMQGAEILVIDKNEDLVMTVGADVLSSADGVFADENGVIYAADSMQKAIFVFHSDGSLDKKIEKPESPLFGAKTQFKPQKLTADKQGNIYIISEGSTNGIIQLNDEGDFLGFFGANKAESTIFRKLQRLLFSDEMMSYFIKNVPSSMSNICIDGEGIVYATTKGDTKEPVKKINIAGQNLFDSVLAEHELEIVSIACDNSGNVFALAGNTGQIVILDSLGNVIGIFGNKNTQDTRLGITMNPVAVCADSDRAIYVADKGAGHIQVYTPTPLMKVLYDAIAFYKEGRYVESEELWQEVLKRNSSVALAYNAVGLSQLKKAEHSEAMASFRLANNPKNYSTAFWEIRQGFLTGNIQFFLLAAVLLSMLSRIWNILRRKTNRLDGWYTAKRRLEHSSVIHEIRTITGVMRHPINTFYDIRYKNSITLKSASVLLVLTVSLLILADYFTGFSFNNVNTASGYLYNPLRNMLTYFLMILLFIGSNFLVTSIGNGQGGLVQILQGTALCLVPIVLLYVPLIVLSNVLTLQEQFVYQFFKTLIFGWCGLLAIIQVMQVQDYGFGEALRSLALTVFTMAVIFVITMVIYMLGREAVVFFASIAEEVIRHGR